MFLRSDREGACWDFAGLFAWRRGRSEHEPGREVRVFESRLVATDFRAHELPVCGSGICSFDLRPDLDRQAPIRMHDQRPCELDVLDREWERKLGSAGDVGDRFAHRLEAEYGWQQMGAFIDVIAHITVSFQVELRSADELATWLERRDLIDKPVRSRQWRHDGLPGIDAAQASRDDDLSRTGVVRHQLDKPRRAFLHGNRIDAELAEALDTAELGAHAHLIPDAVGQRDGLDRWMPRCEPPEAPVEALVGECIPGVVRHADEPDD